LLEEGFYGNICLSSGAMCEFANGLRMSLKKERPDAKKLACLITCLKQLQDTKKNYLQPFFKKMKNS